MTTNPQIDLLSADSNEALDALTIENAKYFTVVQTYRGRFVTTGESNYSREEQPTLKAARARAKELHEETGRKSMIYAVADFIGANNFSRHIENYPATVMPFKPKPVRKTPTKIKTLKEVQVVSERERLRLGRVTL